MKRTWPRTLLPLAAGTLVAGLLTGCPSEVRRPGEAGNRATNMVDVNQDVTRVAAGEPGAGRTAGLVLGNVALLAINLDQPGIVPGPGPTVETRPGATPTGNGGSSTHTTRGGGLTSSPGATGHSATAGGAPGQTAARPGGGHAPGPTIPGGSPTSVSGGGPAAGSPPGYGGPNIAPKNSNLGNVQNAIATSIQQKYPYIVEVRFVSDPAAMRTLADMAAQVGGGRSVVEFLPTLAELVHGSDLAMPLTPMPDGPPQSGSLPPAPRTTGPQGDRY